MVQTSARPTLSALPGWIAALCLTGCFTGGPPAVRGVVRTLPGACAQPVAPLASAAAAAGDGAPLADATVVVTCPDRKDPLLTLHSDAAGRFHQDLTADMPLGCTVTVSKDGFVTRTYELAAICADRAVGAGAPPRLRCGTASLTARLVPAPAVQPATGAPAEGAPAGGAP